MKLIKLQGGKYNLNYNEIERKRKIKEGDRERITETSSTSRRGKAAPFLRAQRARQNGCVPLLPVTHLLAAPLLHCCKGGGGGGDAVEGRDCKQSPVSVPKTTNSSSELLFTIGLSRRPLRAATSPESGTGGVGICRP